MILTGVKLNMKKIVLTGGGSAGHVTANLALLPKLLEAGWEVHYIGTEKGMENAIVPKDLVYYHTIKAGKLRRYFDIKNFADPFNVILGIIQSFLILRKIKPSIVFAKGGYVSLPVIVSSWLLRIPAITHEGDVTIGLANKLALPFVKKICVSFKETLKYSGKKGIYTSLPIRKEILEGNPSSGKDICKFISDKPVILIMGGSQGSRNINKLLRDSLDNILPKFNIVHICGNGNVDLSLNKEGYCQLEYLKDALPHIFAISDIFISRAGTASVFEILALKKPALLVPLTTNASRGEQLLNARTFEKNGFSKVLLENEIASDKLIQEIVELYEKRNIFVENMLKSEVPDSVEEIFRLINELAR